MNYFEKITFYAGHYLFSRDAEFEELVAKAVGFVQPPGFTRTPHMYSITCQNKACLAAFPRKKSLPCICKIKHDYLFFPLKNEPFVDLEEHIDKRRAP